MDTEKLKRQLTEHEDRKNFAYKDSVGKWTIGIGHNLEDTPISDRAVDTIFEDDLTYHITALQRALPWIDQLDEVRQHVLVDMAFNLGVVGLLKFKKMLAACKEGHYSDAVTEMKDSVWWYQVGNRAKVLAYMMETGKEVYGESSFPR